MALSVRLDAKTESLIGRLARRRRQSKSEVIRDAIGVLAKQEEKGGEKKRPYDLVAHLIGCVERRRRKPIAKHRRKVLRKLLRERANARRISLIPGRWWP